jgi:hypothetical protein
MGAGRFPFVYVLDRLGADLVASVLGCDRADLGWKPTSNMLGTEFVSHTLVVNDFRVAMDLVVRTPGLELTDWVGEAQFRTTALRNRVPFRVRGARITRNYPDGYFALSVSGRDQLAHFFLEIDRGTMSNKRWQDKVRAYIEFRVRGLSQKHFGTRNFRLLTVTTTERRLGNLKRATEKVDSDHHFWFAVQNSIDIWNPQTLLAPIWYVAGKDERQSLVPRTTR